MNENFFDDFDSEKDLAEKGYGGRGTPIPNANPNKVNAELKAKEPAAEDYVDPEEDVDNYIEEYTEDQAVLLDQADARLEKGSLYRMLLSHDLFGNVDCPPEIVHQVQEEIKEFILDRLNILLGIKAEQTSENTIMSVDLPFNNIEIEVLKKLAATASKGKSLQEGYNVQAIVSKQPSTIQPLSNIRKAPAIKKLSESGPFRSKSIPTQEVPPPQRLDRQKRPKELLDKKQEESKEMINAWDMTQEQRLAHNKKNQHKYTQTQPHDNVKIPMPNYDQQKMHYELESVKRANQPSALLMQLQSTIESINKDELAAKMRGE